MQVGEAADQGGAEQRLEFIELTAVHQPRDHLAHVIGLLGLRRDDAVQLVGGIQRCARFAGLQLAELAPVEVGHAAAGDGKGVLVVLGVVVGDARGLAVHVGAAQLLGGHHFAGGSLHQRRAGGKMVAWLRTMMVSSAIAGT